MTLLYNISEMPHNEASGNIPVLFIACAGRSGSTLLDRIIGMHDGFCSAGELRYIWERSFGENQLCGCGAPFGDCAFWGEVSRRVFGTEAAQVDATTAIRLQGSLDDIRYAPWLVQSHSPACHQAALLIYSQLLERLYQRILQVSRDRVIVDSSGDATHGLILSQIPSIELHVVHLIRDPRAVAFSWTRARRRPEIHWTSENMPIAHVGASATQWMIHNTMAELLSKSAASYCRLRYEDFVADPDAALSRILAPYGWISGRPKGFAEREVVLERAHTVSGNPMRFKHGPLKIELDDEWRGAMPPRDRRSVTAITWPLLTRYGYPLRSGA
jgi:hypothetical protein